jgi:MFS family permease
VATGAAAFAAGRGPFRYRGFTLFWTARFLNTFATQIVSVAVGWQVYDLTRNPLDLGIVGLVQFLPALMLVLLTGAASDRYNRRRIVAFSQLCEAALVAVMVALTLAGVISVAAIFALLFLFGVARAFVGPAGQSLVPNLVPAEELAGAIAVSTSAWQFATIAGPLAGGLLYGFSAETAYATALVLYVAAATLVFLVPRPPQKTVREATSWATIVAGIRYVRRERIVLGAISLDLFAVLLGGAVALLPAYARDVLDAGPFALGLLRSAAGVGAIAMAIVLTLRPIADHAGRILFVAVALFGLATAVFGVSRVLWLSVAALAVAGAADMISVYVRETLIQLWTPDALRGRVNAVNMVFVGASNEVGEFRAGSVAALIGLVPAVVLGGLGTVAVAGLWAWWFPELRKTRHLGRTPVA